MLYLTNDTNNAVIIREVALIADNYDYVVMRITKQDTNRAYVYAFPVSSNVSGYPQSYLEFNFTPTNLDSGLYSTEFCYSNTGLFHEGNAFATGMATVTESGTIYVQPTESTEYVEPR